MSRSALPLGDAFLPFGPDQSSEVGFISGIDAAGNVAPDNFFSAVPGVGEVAKWSAVAGQAFSGTSGGTVTYSFAPSALWTAGEEGIVIAGLALWSAVANIQFVQVPYNQASPSAVTFFYDNSSPQGNYEQSSYTGTTGGTPGLGALGSAQIVYDASEYGLTQLDSFSQGGGIGIQTVLHEEGHMLGFGHAGPYNFYYNPASQFGPFDTLQWSVMSYFPPTDPSTAYYASYAAQGTNWNGNVPTTWMPLDILAAQRLYGAPVNSPLSGGQVFGFHANIAGPIGQFFDFTINTAPVVTLWDEGANNTLDVSGFAAAAVIDLRPGGFSSVDGMTNDIAIAYFTAIDTAIAGTGDTRFIVNDDRDRLVGGGGNDTVVFTQPGLYTDAGGGVVSRSGGFQDSVQAIGTLAFTGGASTVLAGGGGTIDLSGSPGGDLAYLGDGNDLTVRLGAADTLVGGGGGGLQSVIGAAGGLGALVYGGSEALVYTPGGSNDTVVGQQLTVTGGSAGTEAFGSGAMLAYGGQGYDVFASFGLSSETVQSGAGGGLLVGGAAGNNHYVALGGATDIFAGGPGDVATLDNAAQDIVILGGGAETVDASAGSGGFVAYAGSGADLIEGGLGTDLVALGSGQATVALGSGIGGLIGVDGRGGGAAFVADWKPGSDYIFLGSYGAGADQAAYAAQVLAGGNTLITLADHTQIWLLGTQGVAASTFV